MTDTTHTHEQPQTRDIDVAVFGATGYIGRLISSYLARNHPELTIAIAGRDTGKLSRVRADLDQESPLASPYPVIIVDALDREGLDDLAARSRVVLSTVGPYLDFGAELIAACVEHGTDYVDLSGEAPFVAQNARRHHTRALCTGARIVSACGFDSVPSDIGLLAAHLAAAEHPEDGPITQATMLVHRLRGGLSGGTIASMRGVAKRAQRDPELAAMLADALSLTPAHTGEQDRISAPNGGEHPEACHPAAEDFTISWDGAIDDAVVLDLAEQRVDGLAGFWAGPFFMSPFNTRVVYRSQDLFAQAHRGTLGSNHLEENGKNAKSAGEFTQTNAFSYREGILTGRGLPGQLKARLVQAATKAGLGLLAVPALGPILDRLLPAPGEGPSEQERLSGGFIVVHYARTAHGGRYESTVCAAGDPGYQVTVTMIAEAAVELLATRPTSEAPRVERENLLDPLPAGVLTPATALGAGYIRRLRGCGVTIEAHRV
ncbi:saccharopine dehydrogenase family protein [Corynebacterium atypicum]|uniref:saccharopine dehydrogenase family protein n=1 Tax=Corynebacterium atypicum TaxID=191610 RepID=UPI00068E9960|nr:saccharopine dehydrogenase NADP-binding domain-containing protein [Corynebacterium atypicum]